MSIEQVVRGVATGLFATLLLGVTLGARSTGAQEQAPRQYPAIEFYVGYAYANVNLGSQSAVFLPDGKNYNGVQFDMKLDLTKHFGLVTNTGLETGRSRIPDPLGQEAPLSMRTIQYLEGPELMKRTRNYNLRAHTLMGFTRTNLNEVAGSNRIVKDRTNLAFGVGAAIERQMTGSVSVRIIEADYIPALVGGQWKTTVRASTGLTVRL